MRKPVHSKTLSAVASRPTRPAGRLLSAGLLALGACLFVPAEAAQVACDVDVAPMSLGVYDTLSANANQVTGSVIVTCRILDKGADRISYSIALGPGSGSYARRTMRAAGTAETLGYNVYLQTPSPSRVWGDGTAGTVTASGSITVNKNTPRKPLVLPMIGAVPALQTVAPGVYSDTLTVTVTWN
jgi:spore coat protein U-like protein